MHLENRAGGGMDFFTPRAGPWKAVVDGASETCPGGQPAVSWADAKRICRFGPPLAQREARAGHSGTAYAGIRLESRRLGLQQPAARDPEVTGVGSVLGGSTADSMSVNCVVSNADPGRVHLASVHPMPGSCPAACVRMLAPSLRKLAGSWIERFFSGLRGEFLGGAGWAGGYSPNHDKVRRLTK